MHDQEVKRKMEENTGQISTAGGKTVTVERDLDDIRRTEAAVKEQKVKVLDFSDDGNQTDEGRRGSEGGVRSSGAGYVKSGGIIVKQ